MYFTYIIQSESSARWYIGHTEDPQKRLSAHNSGLNISTKNKGPWRLIFLRAFPGKKQANQFELYLKKLKNKDYIRKVYACFFLGE
jgi:putative endonuclease